MWAPASPSCRLYEPEAVEVIGTYAPEGMRKDGVAALSLSSLIKMGYYFRI
jgi:hypothetical protein